MPHFSFTSLPTAVRFRLTATTSAEAWELAMQLSDGTYDLVALHKLGVQIEEVTFGDHADTEQCETE
ncbi:hypothetical protein ABZY20_25200 [Streptomyces sp. NPDC006624]|uniref:hypothetical protein n=1 Tax=Streptomyces sp. NPDC006624 TaxID=3154892 RepID=UPI0033AF8092